MCNGVAGHVCSMVTATAVGYLYSHWNTRPRSGKECTFFPPLCFATTKYLKIFFHFFYCSWVSDRHYCALLMRRREREREFLPLIVFWGVLSQYHGVLKRLDMQYNWTLWCWNGLPLNFGVQMPPADKTKENIGILFSNTAHCQGEIWPDIYRAKKWNWSAYTVHKTLFLKHVAPPVPTPRWQ